MSALLERAVEAIREERPIVESRGIELIGVSGSVARGEDRSDSDVDIVHRLTGRASLLAVARAFIDLQDRIGRKVDLVDIGHVSGDLRANLERDLVRVRGDPAAEVHRAVRPPDRRRRRIEAFARNEIEDGGRSRG